MYTIHMDKAILPAVINRTIKRCRALRKWARREGVTSYRIYDSDIPAAPLSIDLYELLPQGIATVDCASAFMTEEYRRISLNDMDIAREIIKRQYLVINSRVYGDEKDDIHNTLASLLSAALDINTSHIILKERKRGKGGARYSEYAPSLINTLPQSFTGIVYESRSLFKVDLSTRIDTGLFLDNRPLRSILRTTSYGMSVLNLFCYTGSLSVAAAKGGAAQVTSIDLSNTYLDWAKSNMAINGFTENNTHFIKSDVRKYLKSQVQQGNKYGIIILDPPTFSSSSGTAMLDLLRDWRSLVSLCLPLLSANGILYFSTNSRRLRVASEDAPKGYTVTDITPLTTPPDFPLHKVHRCYCFMHEPSTLPQPLLCHSGD